MSNDAQKRAYKAYNKKSIQLAVSYRPSDIAEGLRIKAYLAETGQSANSYIKALIKSDLDAKNVSYPDNTDNTDNRNTDK